MADPIKHVIVLMFENHSFDQMLGCLRSVHPELDGVDPAHPGSNQDSAGRVYLQQPSNDTVVDPDPMHDLKNVLHQLEGGNAGFVSDYEQTYPTTTSDQRQQIMDYFAAGTLPALHTLAENFTVCDHWFSSVPGPTWANRFFVHSATCMGLVTMPTGLLPTKYYLGYDQDTIYDRLNESGIPWRIHHGDVPQSLVLRHQQQPRNALHYHFLDRFFHDAEGNEHDFPQYVFIEPNYFHVPFEQPQNDDHPPHSTTAAQELLANVYNAVRSNADLWNSTLLVVVYDEHGGFYDREPPPSAVPPDTHKDEYTFDRLGVRVPAVLVSPWVGRGVLDTEFDHTSLLRYLVDTWKLRSLTERDRAAKSFDGAIRRDGQPRTDTPPSLSVPAADMAASVAALDAAEPAGEPNAHQQALLTFTEHLESQTTAPTTAAAPLAAAATATSAVRGHLVRQRVESFLNQQKAKAAAVAAPPG